MTIRSGVYGLAMIFSISLTKFTKLLSRLTKCVRSYTSLYSQHSKSAEVKEHVIAYIVLELLVI